MTRARVWVRGVVLHTAWFLWFYALAAFPVYFAYLSMKPVYALLIMAVPFAGYGLIRSYCKRLTLFLRANAVLTAAVITVLLKAPISAWHIWLGNVQLNIFIVFAMIILLAALGLSIYFRLTPTKIAVYETGHAIFFTITLIVVCIICEYLEAPEMTRAITWIAVVLMALRYVFGHIYNVDYSLDIFTQSQGGNNTRNAPTEPASVSHVPSILSFNNKLILAFIVLMLLASLAAGTLGLGGGLRVIFTAAGNGFVALLRFLFSFGKDTPEATPEPYTYVPDDVGEDPMEELIAMYDNAEPAMFWVVLEKISIVVVWVVIIAAVIAGVVLICRRLYLMFYGKRENIGGDISESVLPDVANTVRARFSFAGGGPVNRIRRLFYRKVKKHVARGDVRIDPGDTACVIAEKIKASEDIDALTERYQQARYG